jgi:hemoglobin
MGERLGRGDHRRGGEDFGFGGWEAGAGEDVVEREEGAAVDGSGVGVGQGDASTRQFSWTRTMAVPRVGEGRCDLEGTARWPRERARATRFQLVTTGGPTSHDGSMSSVYEAAGGREGMLRLAAAWHERVLADEVVEHAFSHGYHPEHTERLAAYWAEALGGPADYTARYGDETGVVRMHSGNGPHEEMDRRAVACFDAALEDCGLTAEPLRGTLHDYFAWATAQISRYDRDADDVPAGLALPHWSWDGPV